MTRSTRRLTITAAALIALAVPNVASGQEPGIDGYGGIGGEVQNEVGSNDLQGGIADDLRASTGSDATADTSPDGSLPVTGSDVLTLGLGGILLVAVGGSIAWLDRRLRRPTPAAGA